MSVVALRRPLPRSRWCCLAIALLLAVGCGGDAQLSGMDLQKAPAPEFSLIDQRGRAVQLADLQGQALVLTFIYTSCPDICPLIVERIKQAQTRLPQYVRERVAVVTITVDPERDTPPVLQAFLDQHSVGDDPRWYALTGDATTLAAVWDAYGVDPGAVLASSTGGTHQHDATQTPRGHTSTVFVIDQQGRQRALLSTSFDPADLASDLEAVVE
jgi:protein SCO1/2